MCGGINGVGYVNQTEAHARHFSLPIFGQAKNGARRTAERSVWRLDRLRIEIKLRRDRDWRRMRRDTGTGVFAMDRVERFGLNVDGELAVFLEQQALPGTGVDADAFWRGFAGLVAEFAPRNRALVAKRADL